MRGAIENYYFRFFHEKNVFCSVCKDPHTTLGFGALKWPPLAALLCDIFAACAKEPRRYALECFFKRKINYFLKEYVVSRFSKDMHSQLGSGWCRQGLRDAPRWRQKRQKGSKISLAPHGGQAKSVKRYVWVGEWICSTCRGIYDKNR